MTDAYEKLFTYSKKTRLLDSIKALLDWDQETYMPKEGHANRSEQIGLMAELIHKEKTSPEYKKLLEELIDLESGEIKQSQNDHLKNAALTQWRRDFVKAEALPHAFVKELAIKTSESMHVWQEAKKENNFKLFAPYLEKMFSLARKQADYLGYDDHPYDALLDCYEPMAKTREIETLFSSLKESITTLLKKIVSSSKEIDETFLHGSFSAEQQQKFGHFILEKIGFDFNCGRLDVSAHPFSTSFHPKDSRITTRYTSSSLFDSISTILHEAGHSFYEMGLLTEYYGSPICEHVSLGIHESQSRFWETRIGQNKHFWAYFYRYLQKHYPQNLSTISLDQFYKAINQVKPSYIRVESDEVTYSLHVILRFELEKSLIEGSLKVKDIPDAWNEKMQNYLGITPKTDTEGCLQDVHWSHGLIGYFPTYTLGNIYCGQLFECFSKDFPNWEERLTQGDFIFIKPWLSKHIFQFGRAYSPSELIKKVTGEPLNTRPYLDYLDKKYTEIYQL